ncbi:Ig-like domain-containing protein, partial [Candidatus Woesearchaeota archaeon]|nr:Ig-like domain-containing protein [Candidatus Woesearchaeota archaeon]
VTFDITYDSNSSSVAGYPKNILTDSSGFAQDNWTAISSYENFTVNVTDTDNGINKTQGFEILAPAVVNGTMTDSNNQTVNATFLLYDENGTLINNVSNSYDWNLSYGTNYQLQILPNNHVITKMTFNGMKNMPDSSNVIRIDDPADGKWNNVYAIDPTGMNFTSAVITVTAANTPKNKILYKCQDWNFTAQNCYGNWTAWQAISPGQEYNVTITPIDPALSEGNGTFFEGFESGSLLTNNWTNTGAGNDWVIDTNYPYAGTYAIEGDPQGLSFLETNVSTAGFYNITFSYYREDWAMDAGEYCGVDWYNGTDWIELDNSSIGWGYTQFVHFLPSSADNNPNLKIRFKVYAGLPNEECYVDNVKVMGNYTDSTPPTVTNIQPTAGTQYLTNTTLIISANVTDELGISSVKANITWDNETELLDMTFNSTLGLYVGLFTNATIEDTYNITIIANDTIGKVNKTETSYFETLLQAIVYTDYPAYGKVLTVDITGIRFTPNSTVNLELRYPNSSLVSGYPKNLTSNTFGNINDSWFISASEPFGNYTIYANDTVNALLEDNTTFEVKNAAAITFSVLNNTGGNTNSTIHIYNSTGELDHNCTSPCNYTMDYGISKNIEIIPMPEFALHRITYFGFNTPEIVEYVIHVDNPPENVSKPSNIRNWSEVIALGSVFQNYDNFELMVEHQTGNGIYECIGWNMINETCDGYWTRIQSTIDWPRNTTILLSNNFLDTNTSFGVGDEIITVQRNHFEYMSPESYYIMQIILYNQMDYEITNLTLTEEVPVEWFGPSRKGEILNITGGGVFNSSSDSITWDVGTINSKERIALNYTILTARLKSSESEWTTPPFNATADYMDKTTEKDVTNIGQITIKGIAIPSFTLIPAQVNASTQYAYILQVANQGSVALLSGSNVTLDMPSVCTIDYIGDSGYNDSENIIYWNNLSEILSNNNQNLTFNATCDYWTLANLPASIVGVDFNNEEIDTTQNLLLDVVDTNSPIIANVSTWPNVAGINNTVRITADITDDLLLLYVRAEITYPNGTKSNRTMNLYTGNTYRLLFDNTAKEGVYNYTIVAKDKGFNTNETQLYNFTVRYDINPPEWSNNKTIPASSSIYNPGTAYQFNVTWTDNTTVHVVLIEHNFTGTLTNYTITEHEGGEYYYNYPYMDAGTYAWRMYANDTSGYGNWTDQFTYSVQKAGSSVNLTLGGSESNITANISDPVEIVGTFAHTGNYSSLNPLDIALIVWNISDNSHPGGGSCGGTGSHMPWNSELENKLESDSHNVTYIYHNQANNANYDYRDYDLIIVEHFCAQESVDDLTAPNIDSGILNSGKPLIFSAVYDNEFDFTTTDDDTYTTGTTHYIQSNHYITEDYNAGSEINLYNNPGAGEVSLVYLGSNMKSTIKKLVNENNDSSRTIIAAHKTQRKAFFGAGNYDNLTSTGWDLFERTLYWIITQENDTIKLYENGTLIANASGIANITRTYSAPGTYNITAVHEGSDNYNSSTKTYWVEIQQDTISPIIYLESPANNATLNSTSVVLKYNVTDNSEIANCSLILDGAVNQNDSSITKSVSQNFTLTLSNGDYNWSINCTDNSSNYNSGNSSTRNFTVSALYCGDGRCNNGESCSSCSADCGRCSSGGGGGGGGSGGGGGGGGSTLYSDENDEKNEMPLIRTCLKEDQSVAFYIKKDHKTVATLTSMDESSASLTVGEEETSVRLNNDKKVDSDDNGRDDVRVELFSIEEDKACFWFYELREGDEEEEAEGKGTGCKPSWKCDEWSKCSPYDTQTRTCADENNCGTTLNKPIEVQSCMYGASCYDGIQNQDETGVDCGGVCGSCEKRTTITGSAISVQPGKEIKAYYLIPTILLLIILIALIALRKADISERTKKILTVMHVVLMVLIAFLLLASFTFIGSKITGLFGHEAELVHNLT